MNITYLFGAGASYNSIPIVGELEKAFNLLRQWHKGIHGGVLAGTHGMLDSLLTTAAHNSNIYGTVDTFAKKLYISNHERELEKLKAVISLFFSVWQESKISTIDLSAVRTIGRFKDIDHRYLGLLTNYLQPLSGQVKFSSSVKFLTWNYDTQLERALAVILDKEVNEVITNYNIYPFVNESDPVIVHLNGVAGWYENNKKTNSLFREKSPIGVNHPAEVLKNLLSFIPAVERGESSVSNMLTFAWEREKSNRAIDSAISILNETDILIVVGYSFPTFNDEIDKSLFKVLTSNGRNAIVYYQDPNANKSIIQQRFGVDESFIRIEKENLNQFLLPLERNPTVGYYP